MATYHCTAKVIGRSAGRSAVGAAAYRSGSELRDERTGDTHDFTAKDDIVHSEILLPEGAPERLSDRSTLWNEVERREIRRDAQLAREVEFSLPRELTTAQNIALARDFTSAFFVKRGMIADLNVHVGKGLDAEGNPADKPHAHVMLTMRAVDKNGFGLKVTEWNQRALLAAWREAWAVTANERLAALGHTARIDHRSFKEQGIPLEPQNKIGPAGARRDARGEAAERADEHREIARANGDRIIADPAIALEILTRHAATFSRRDMLALAHRHSEGRVQFEAVTRAIRGAANVIELPDRAIGDVRFTTHEMVQAEARLLAAASALAGDRSHAIVAKDEAVGPVAKAGQGELVLSTEQSLALVSVTAGSGLQAVVGVAGTGKSRMLGEAAKAWVAAGLRPQGAALSGIAAEGLEHGSGIPSRTLHSLEYAWKQGRELLDRRSVLVIDEAGMVGTRQLGDVLERAAEAGAKVVLVGDPEQLQSIEAGAAFRLLGERFGAAALSEVRRQTVPWQRDATVMLATGATGQALGAYEKAGMVEGVPTAEAGYDRVVALWADDRAAHPQATRLMLAPTREAVGNLNDRARGRLLATGEIRVSRSIETERGERPIGIGETVMFLRNDRDLGVRNGSVGQVSGIEGEGATASLTVALGSGREARSVELRLVDYAHIDHGYAMTVHKAQSATVDRAFILAGPSMDRHAAYAALTRHRIEPKLVYAIEDFASGREGAPNAAARERMVQTLSRERSKDMAHDYDVPEFAETRSIEGRFATLAGHIRDAWEAVKARDGEAFAQALGKALTGESMSTASPAHPEPDAAVAPGKSGLAGLFARMASNSGKAAFEQAQRAALAEPAKAASRITPAVEPKLEPTPEPEKPNPERDRSRQLDFGL